MGIVPGRMFALAIKDIVGQHALHVGYYSVGF